MWLWLCCSKPINGSTSFTGWSPNSTAQQTVPSQILLCPAHQAPCYLPLPGTSHAPFHPAGHCAAHTRSALCSKACPLSCPHPANSAAYVTNRHQCTDAWTMIFLCPAPQLTAPSEPSKSLAVINKCLLNEQIIVFLFYVNKIRSRS